MTNSQLSMTITLSALIESRRWKLWVIIMIVFDILRHLSIYCRRRSIASISRPESISSSIITLGSRSSICNISIRRFSPPEKPTYRSLSRKDTSNHTFGKIFSTIRRNTKEVGTLSFGWIREKCALYTVLRYSKSFIPVISGTFWNDKNIHFSCLLLGESHDISSLFRKILPIVR